MRAKLLIALLLVAACNAKSPTENITGPQPGDFAVLFVGNSLTYWNTLPAIVAALADSANVTPLAWGMVAEPDFSLEDHWISGEARRAIGLGNWDYVILQQGPSTLPQNRAHLISWTRRFDAEIKNVGGKTALYSIWPAADRPNDFTLTSTSYRLAADSVGGVFMPAADAWVAARQRSSSIQLYSPDGLHPTTNGSYLAALVIFQRLYNRSPVGLARRMTLDIRGQPLLEITAADAEVLQAAAAEATR